MKTLIFTPVFLICLAFGHCQNTIAGVYKSNFAIKGAFVETLNLACDSTFEFIRYGDASHPSIKGKWGVLDEHIFLIADTAAGKRNGYFWQTFFLEEGRLLAFSPEDYKMFVKNMMSYKDTSVKRIDIPEPNMAYYKNKGKLKLYYLAKVSSAHCNSNQ